MSQRFPMPIPFGWFFVHYSDELKTGDVKSLHYFGEDLVLFRNEQGEVGLTEAYCPHLGAHLGDGEVVGEIGKGFNLLLGIKEDDTEADMDYIINKVVGLRVFEDADDKMNLSLGDVDGELLVVSQFTLYGDCRKGRRPSFIRSGPVALAEEKYKRFVEKISAQPIKKVAFGEFQADMAAK